MTIQRIFCTDCRWVGVDSEVLRAPNPFTPVEELWGCPKCHGVNTMVRACEIEGCNEVGSIGDFGRDGVYRITCHKHAPWREEET
jgi:hypothetical protein